MIDPLLREEAPAVTSKTLRQFAALCVVFFGGLAYWHGVRQGRVSLGLIMTVLAIGVGSIGLMRPEKIRPIYTGLIVITFPIGRVLSIVLLGGLFYFVFVPVGLVFRLIGRDALHVRRPEDPTHWKTKPAVKDLRSYVRQS